MMRSSVDLPPPLGPSSAVSEPVGHLERDVVERHGVAEALRDATRPRCSRRRLPCQASRLRSVRVSSRQHDERGEAQGDRADVGALGVEVVDALRR